MKTIKYILGILMVIGGFGTIIKGTLFGSFTLILLGALFFPPISDKIKEYLRVWENKGIRYTFYILLFLTSAGLIKKNGISGHSTTENSTSKAKIAYQEYINQVHSNISNLSSERKQQRDKWLKELSDNSVYIELVGNKAVSSDYLPILTAINEAIKNSILENGKSQFRISDEIASKVENSNNGEEKMQFVIITSSLSLKMNGGLPEEIVSIFDRYRTKYGLYNDGEKIFFDNSGKSEKLNNGFNISAATALFSPNDEKVLNSLYESNFSTVGNWSDEEVIFENAFMVQKAAYIKYLKTNYPKSKYLPQMEKCKVWDKYDPIVKDRIELMIFNKDCRGLQEEFNTTAENSERIQASGRTADRNLDLMEFLDEQMRALNCNE